MKTIHHVLDIDVPRRSVWSALTEPDGHGGLVEHPVDEPGGGGRCARRLDVRRRLQPGHGDQRAERAASSSTGGASAARTWDDNTFRFQLAPLDDGRTRLRFWQDYATELSDDDYGIYNFNWGYYLESLRLLCAPRRGQAVRRAR